MAEKNNNSGKEIVLKVLMHCEGCQTKVSNCLRCFEGVEEVVVDYPNQKVTVKGKKADPLKVLKRVQKKYSRNAELISPKLKPENNEKKEPEKKEKAVPPVKVLVLKVSMHCEGCANDIEKYLEKMKGVLSVEANMESSMVTVRGIVDAPKLIEYMKKQLGKNAEIVTVKQEQAAGDKCQTKDKLNNNNNNKNKNNNNDNKNNKKCPEAVEIIFQYPQYCPCQIFNEDNPIACSIM